MTLVIVFDTLDCELPQLKEKSASLRGLFYSPHCYTKKKWHTPTDSDKWMVSNSLTNNISIGQPAGAIWRNPDHLRINKTEPLGHPICYSFAHRFYTKPLYDARNETTLHGRKMTAQLLSIVSDATNRRRMAMENGIDPRPNQWDASCMERFIDGNRFGDYEKRRDWEVSPAKLDD